MLQKELAVLNIRRLAEPIKVPKQLAQHSREIAELNFAGILQLLRLLLLVLKKPVVIIQPLLRMQIAKPSYQKLLEPLIQNVLQMELDALIILEAVQASLEPSKNVEHLRLQMVPVKLQPQEALQPQEHEPQEFVLKL